jgi:cyanophycinase
VNGAVALVGGAEFTPPAGALDAWLLQRCGSDLVTVIPTAARQRPDMAVRTARRHFRRLGGEVAAEMILTRTDAEDPAIAARLASARLLYIAGGDPRYLASVLQATPAWAGILDAVSSGAVLAGSSAGAMVLCARMLVPGSRATEPGLGLLQDLVVLPHHNRWRHRLGEMAAAVGSGDGQRLVGIDEATGLVLDGGLWRVLGAGSVTLYEPRPAGTPPAVVWSAAAPAVLEPCR